MNRIALVTGAAGGIGFATAQKLCAAGMTVLGMDIAPKMPADIDGDFTYFQGDLSRAEDRQAFVHTAEERYGRVDVLVNVAGVAPRVRADLLTMTEESYDFVMDINTKGTLFLTQAVANAMLRNEGEQKGAIVNISSMSAYTSSTNRGGILHLQGRGVHDHHAVCRPIGGIRHSGQRGAPRHHSDRHDRYRQGQIRRADRRGSAAH